jgi:uncharacterized circularly permuted ATP-grasp superfamily protein
MRTSANWQEQKQSSDLVGEHSSQRPSRTVAAIQPLFDGYRPLAGTYDEFFDGSADPRSEVSQLIRALDGLGRHEFLERQRLASSAFLNAGVTFSVYSDKRGTERIFPFDLIPRVVPGDRWAAIEKGLVQRITALNTFLLDVYGEQRILRDRIIPRELVLGSAGYLERMRGVRPPGDIHIHIAGIDLIRDPDGEFLVLEDNVRTPSGVSYVLENRGVMKRALPQVFGNSPVRSVDDYPARLKSALNHVSPVDSPSPHIVVLTPGPYNSAYFEHSFLARRLGCELVQGSDLFVDRERVFLKTTAGPQQVDVIYRRVDDDFLDPEMFRKDSLLGVPGLMRAYMAGNVAIANAVGNGVADDKGIYPFVPQMIRYYLSEEPLLGQVKTYVCAEPSDRMYVLENLERLVVKAVDASGGYGMLIGPSAARAEIERFRGQIAQNPRGYIAQPRIELSTAPTWCDSGIAPRRLDLRPYVIMGQSKSIWVLPGGLTRVALKDGSYVVNSSQGGGSKDTWVLGSSSV